MRWRPGVPGPGGEDAGEGVEGAPLVARGHHPPGGRSPPPWTAQTSVPARRPAARPDRVGRIVGIDLNKPRTRAALSSALVLAPVPGEFTAAEFTAKLQHLTRHDGYATRQAATTSGNSAGRASRTNRAGPAATMSRPDAAPTIGFPNASCYVPAPLRPRWSAGHWQPSPACTGSMTGSLNTRIYLALPSMVSENSIDSILALYRLQRTTVLAVPQ